SADHAEPGRAHQRPLDEAAPIDLRPSLRLANGRLSRLVSFELPSVTHLRTPRLRLAFSTSTAAMCPGNLRRQQSKLIACPPYRPELVPLDKRHHRDAT